MDKSEVCAAAEGETQVSCSPLVALGAAGAVCVGDNGEALKAARRRIENIVRAARSAVKAFAPR